MVNDSSSHNGGTLLALLALLINLWWFCVGFRPVYVGSEVFLVMADHCHIIQVPIRFSGCTSNVRSSSFPLLVHGNTYPG